MSLFCLVHGSGQGPSGWDLLVPELTKRGHRTVCVDLPTNEPDAGAARYAQVIAEAVEQTRKPAIVVAHSASGMFLPLVPDYYPVEHMVFLAALIPEPGKSVRQRFQADREMFNPEWVGQDPTTYPFLAKKFVFHDCGPAVAEWALTTMRLMYARAAMEEPCPLQRWPKVPSTYILPREDRTINPEWWRREATRLLGKPPLEIGGGHCPFISRPVELAEMLSRICSHGR
jgi:pimeloyl-ACP methyl ester carboxylesterase